MTVLRLQSVVLEKLYGSAEESLADKWHGGADSNPSMRYMVKRELFGEELMHSLIYD